MLHKPKVICKSYLLYVNFIYIYIYMVMYIVDNLHIMIIHYILGLKVKNVVNDLSITQKVGKIV